MIFAKDSVGCDFDVGWIMDVMVMKRKEETEGNKTYKNQELK